MGRFHIAKLLYVIFPAKINGQELEWNVTTFFPHAQFFLSCKNVVISPPLIPVLLKRWMSHAPWPHDHPGRADNVTLWFPPRLGAVALWLHIWSIRGLADNHQKQAPASATDNIARLIRVILRSHYKDVPGSDFAINFFKIIKTI